MARLDAPPEAPPPGAPPLADAASGPGGEVTATFRTSWRAVFSGWGLAGLPVLGVVLWASGAPFDAGMLAVVGIAGAVVAVGLLAWEALAYRLFGVTEVRVAPEAVEVVGHGGAVRRVPRRKLEGAWLERRWVLRARGESAVVRDRGFTTDDWLALSAALSAWKVEDAHGRLPATDRQRGGAVFEPRRPWTPALALGAFAAFFVAATALMLPSYLDGTWIKDPGLTVLFPLFGIVLAALAVVNVPRLVRRATFGPDAVTFDRLLGGSRTVPYEDVLDAHGGWVDTRAGSFFVGRRDDDVFWHLLDERLAEGQMLTGRRWAEWALWGQPRVLLGGLAGALVVWAASVRLAPAGWAEVAALVALVAWGLALWAVVKVRARRLLRDAD